MSTFTQVIAGCFEATPATRRLSDTDAKPINARYDAARDSNETENIWLNADALDADASNSLAVRTRLRKRSRYERGNNGHNSGILRTQANYVVGTGPKLRMTTNSSGFNAMVEAAWKRWTKATKFARKLRTMCRAKCGDGEAFAILAPNPNCPDSVKLSLRLIECDQVTAPIATADKEGYIDGIHFDEYGNPVAYDILRRHPGANWYWTAGAEREYKTYDAKHVCHWYGGDERPGQHRGIPEMTPTLNLFATGRRYREAVVAAAEEAANNSVMIAMGTPQDGPDEVRPFTTLPTEKRKMVVLPGGATATQMKAEQPTTTHDSFIRSMVCEEARPLNMPYNIAACDSSGYSYSGGQLDHQTFFVSVDVERQDCEGDVVEKTFAAWYQEAVRVYGWVDNNEIPSHEWGWTGKPHNDPTKIANSRQTRLACGDAAPGEFASDDGVDFDDRVAMMARNYGKTESEIRAALFDKAFGQSTSTAGSNPPQNNDDDPPSPPPTTTNPRTNANSNGHHRLLEVL